MTSQEPSADNPTRLAQAAAGAFEAIYHRLAPHRQQSRDAAISAWLEGHEDDAVALVRDLLADVAVHPDTPEAARPIFHLLTKPEHQTQAILTVLGVYPIISAFVMAAVQPFVTDISNQAWAGHPSQPLSPADMALAKLRNAPTNIDAYDEARKSGIDSDRFDVLEYITGEPPGLMQLLEAFRRGYIDEPTLHKGVLQSRVRDEWYPTVKALQYAVPSPLEVIAGVVKGHLSNDDGRKLAMEGGLAPDMFDWVLQTAGRPPGAEQLLGLLNRGLIDEATFGDAIRQSDIQDRWIPELLETRRYLPPPRSIVSMIRGGAITDDYARTLLADHGVIATDIDLFIAEGHASKTETIKHLALGEVQKLYEARMITRADAVTDIALIGYNADEAAQILALVDSARDRKYREAAITRVHSQIVNHRIDGTEASTDLDAIGVDPTERDSLLKLWALETASNVKILTLAQVQGAWRRSIMTTDEAGGRLLELGYHLDDVPYLLALSLPPTKFTQRTPQDVP